MNSNGSETIGAETLTYILETNHKKMIAGWMSLSHGGYLTPFNSQMSLFPALNLGIFTVTNGPGRLLPNVTHAKLHHDIFDIIQGQG